MRTTFPSGSEGPDRIERLERLERLERRRDQALRDLLDLDRQVDEGELLADEAEPLRRRYERGAAEAIAQLAVPAMAAPVDRLGAAAAADTIGAADAVDDGQRRPPVPAPTLRSRPTWRAVLYAGAAGGAVIAAAVVLPPALQARPEGGFVTGNEMLADPTPTPTPTQQPQAVPPPGRDLSQVTNQEMEAVVESNPDVVGMRMALAERYVGQADYDKAVAHYKIALDRDPDNAEAMAHLGWVLLQLGSPREAEQLIDRALASEPGMADAWWFKANARLYGASDPSGTVEALKRMQRLPLSPEVSIQVSRLMALAEEQSRTSG